MAKKHDVTVFTTDPGGKLPRVEEINGVQVKRFRAFSPDNAYFFAPEMLAEMRKFRFDIVHGHNYHASPLLLCTFANTSSLIITPHYHRYGSSIFRDILIKLYKPLGKRIFQGASVVISLCEYEKKLLIKDFNIDERKIKVVPNGLNKAEFDTLRKKKGEHKTILYVSRLLNYKGVHYAIRALPLLDTDIRLEIVGSGPEKEALVNLAKDLGVLHRIDFYQELGRNELLDRYSGADLLLLLSQHEAFGIVVTEALAAKIPCIVSSCSGLVQWIDGKNCFAIEYPINIEHLARLIQSVIGKEVNEVRLWDWDEVVNQLETIYAAQDR